MATTIAPTSLECQFTGAQITSILEQSIVYSCACPAQVCKAINLQRELFEYQVKCLNSTDIDAKVHQGIAEACRVTHTELERCLTDILKLEGWNMETLTIPSDLVKRLLGEIQR